MIECYDAMRL